MRCDEVKWEGPPDQFQRALHVATIFNQMLILGEDVRTLSPVKVNLLQLFPIRHGVEEDALALGYIEAGIDYLVGKL